MNGLMYWMAEQKLWLISTCTKDESLIGSEVVV